MSGQVIGQTERTAARKADGQRREPIAGVQQGLVSHAWLARMARALLPPGSRPSSASACVYFAARRKTWLPSNANQW